MGHDIAKQENATYGNNGWDDDKWSKKFFFCLWYDPALNPSMAGASQYNFYGTGGQYIWRTDTDFSDSSTGLVIVSSSAKKNYYDHWSSDFGHFILVRADDYLLINSGQYSYGNAQSDNHDRQPWSHNTIVVNGVDYEALNKGAPAGSANYTQGSGPQAIENDWAEMPRYQAGGDTEYAFAQTDFSNCYLDSVATEMVRNVVLIDEKYLITYDLVTKVNTAHQTIVHWQMMPEPVATDSGWDAVGGDNYDDKAGNNFEWVQGASKAYATVLSPAANVTLRQVGTEGANRSFDEVYADQGGTSDAWRVEVLPATGNADDRILTVIQPMASGGSEETVALLGTIDSDFIGLEIRATTRAVVLFSIDGEDEVAGSFTVSDANGTIKGVIADIVSGVYDVTQTGEGVIADDVAVDSAGIIYFTADLANGSAFTFAADGGGDVTPPEVVSTTVGSDGETITIAFTETVSTDTYDANDFDLDCVTAGDGLGLAYSSGDDSNTIIFTSGTTINAGDSCNVDYTGSTNDIEDAVGNDLVGFSDGSVTNNSSQGITVQVLGFISSGVIIE